MSSSGTVIITGANGTLALGYVTQLLQQFPNHHAVLTVRNPAATDPNTARLKAIVTSFPNAKTSLHALDLSTLAAVHTFASTIAAEIAAGELPPIAAIVCNAFAWSLTTGLKHTPDNIELSFQVNHLSHFTLVLRLLECMDPNAGRIVVLSSDSHYPGKNGLETFPVAFPEDPDELAHPRADKVGEETGRGFQRYGLSKLCVVMFVYELNRRLQLDPKVKNITALSMDPGGMPDSRCMNGDVPRSWWLMMKYVIGPLQPLLKFAIPTLRKSTDSARDLLELSLGAAYSGQRGYFTLSSPDKSSPESYETPKWKVLWDKSIELSGLKPGSHILQVD